jgi:hypothetical protein
MRHMLQSFAVALATLLAVMATAGFKSTGKDGKDSVVSPGDARLLAADARVGGESFGALTARWWQWAHAAEFPPYLDPDGRVCTIGQGGPVWFLAGTNGTFEPTRRCVVPSGKHVLLPVINMMHLNPYDGPRQRTCAELQAAAAVNNDGLRSAIVSIDGEAVADVAQYRVRSDGCFRIDAGDATSPLAASDGYWLLLKPLPNGRHTIRVGANYGVRDSGYGLLRQNFEYVIDVGGAVNIAAR